ncbi:hypothetical protein ACQ4WX_35300 [Streptomyces lasalocidi]
MKQKIPAREAVALLRTMTRVLCAVGVLALIFTTVNVTRFATSRNVAGAHRGPPRPDDRHSPCRLSCTSTRASPPGASTHRPGQPPCAGVPDAPPPS